MLIALWLPTVAYSQAARTAADLVAEANQVIKTVDVFEAQKRLRSTGSLLIDVREKDEFDAGHIPGAVNIPRGLLEFVIPSMTTDVSTEILLYCKKGGRGALAAFSLHTMGYKSTTNIAGGFDAWVAAELAMTRE